MCTIRGFSFSLFFLLFLYNSASIAQLTKPEFDNGRGRLGVGGGGTIAFKTLGGINARAYLQFSPYWKIALSGTNVFKYDSLSDKAFKEVYLDLSLLHPIKEYHETDILYVFGGVSAVEWSKKRNKNPKFEIVGYNFTNKNDTSLFLGAINLGIGFEKAIGPIAFFSELKTTIGAPSWLMATIGLKTNFGRIFKDPKKRYNLDTVNEFGE